MPKVERLVPRRFVVLKHRLSTGERFSILIDGATGVPPTLPLRFALSQRNRGGSARLEKYLRRIGDLYDWALYHDNVRLDEQILVDGVVRLDQLDRALRELLLPPAGRPFFDRPRLSNERLTAWSLFLEFVYRPGLWRTGLRVLEGHALRYELEDELRVLLVELRKLRTSISESRPHDPLNERELEAIDEALDPGNEFCPFEDLLLQRNSLMYYTARFAAARLGEILKSKLDDLPGQLSAADEIERQLTGTAKSLHIVRRPDDFDDSREYEPNVKRHDRFIPLPDDVLDLFSAYCAKTNTRRRTQYLFLTDDNTRPLSQSRAHKVIKQLGEAAAKVHERQHGVEAGHTLRRLSWHRLRHTRALELLPVYFPNYQWDAMAEDQFLAFFGWANAESARPYLNRLYRRNAQARLDAHHAELRAP